MLFRLKVGRVHFSSLRPLDGCSPTDQRDSLSRLPCESQTEVTTVKPESSPSSIHSKLLCLGTITRVHVEVREDVTGDLSTPVIRSYFYRSPFPISRRWPTHLRSWQTLLGVGAIPRETYYKCSWVSMCVKHGEGVPKVYGEWVWLDNGQKVRTRKTSWVIGWFDKRYRTLGYMYGAYIQSNEEGTVSHINPPVLIMSSRGRRWWVKLKGSGKTIRSVWSGEWLRRRDPSNRPLH